MASGVPVLDGATATASRTIDLNKYPWITPDLMIDGNFSGQYHTAKSVFHSAGAATFIIEFTESKTINTILAVAREDHYNTVNFEMYIGDDPEVFIPSQLFGTLMGGGILDCGFKGKYFGLKSPGALVLAELRLFEDRNIAPYAKASQSSLGSVAVYDAQNPTKLGVHATTGRIESSLTRTAVEANPSWELVFDEEITVTAMSLVGITSTVAYTHNIEVHFGSSSAHDDNPPIPGSPFFTADGELNTGFEAYPMMSGTRLSVKKQDTESLGISMVAVMAAPKCSANSYSWSFPTDPIVVTVGSTAEALVEMVSAAPDPAPASWYAAGPNASDCLLVTDEHDAPLESPFFFRNGKLSVIPTLNSQAGFKKIKMAPVADSSAASYLDVEIKCFAAAYVWPVAPGAQEYTMLTDPDLVIPFDQVDQDTCTYTETVTLAQADGSDTPFDFVIDDIRKEIKISAEYDTLQASAGVYTIVLTRQLDDEAQTVDTTFQFQFTLIDPCAQTTLISELPNGVHLTQMETLMDVKKRMTNLNEQVFPSITDQFSEDFGQPGLCGVPEFTFFKRNHRWVWKQCPNGYNTCRTVVYYWTNEVDFLAVDLAANIIKLRASSDTAGQGRGTYWSTQINVFLPRYPTIKLTYYVHVQILQLLPHSIAPYGRTCVKQSSANQCRGEYQRNCPAAIEQRKVEALANDAQAEKEFEQVIKKQEQLIASQQKQARQQEMTCRQIEDAMCEAEKGKKVEKCKRDNQKRRDQFEKYQEEKEKYEECQISEAQKKSKGRGRKKKDRMLKKCKKPKTKKPPACNTKRKRMLAGVVSKTGACVYEVEEWELVLPVQTYYISPTPRSNPNRLKNYEIVQEVDPALKLDELITMTEVAAAKSKYVIHSDDQFVYGNTTYPIVLFTKIEGFDETLIEADPWDLEVYSYPLYPDEPEPIFEEQLEEEEVAFLAPPVEEKVEFNSEIPVLKIGFGTGLTYILPAAKASDGSTVVYEVDLGAASAFVNYNEAKRAFKVTSGSTDEADEGNYSIAVKLSTESGLDNSITITLNLVNPDELFSAGLGDDDGSKKKDEKKKAAQAAQDAKLASQPKFKARVKKFTKLGVMIVGFSQNLLVDNDTLTIVNETLSTTEPAFDVWMEVNGGKPLGEDYEFTWNVTSITKSEMRIQFYFANPFVFADKQNTHEMVLDFKAEAKYNFISLGYTFDAPANFRKGIVTQMPAGDPFTETFSALAGSSGDATAVVSAGVAVMNVAMGTSMSLLWGMIEYLQLVVYMPLLGTEYPANASFLSGILASVASFDIINTDDFYMWMFSFAESESLSISFEELGFESMNFVMNMGSSFIILFLAPMAFILYYVNVNEEGRFQWARTKYNDFKKDLHWNGLIQWTARIYLDMCIMGLIQLRGVNFSGSNCFSTLFAIASVGVVVVFPIWQVVFYYRQRQLWNTKLFREKYSSTLDSLQTKDYATEGVDVTALLVPTFFLIRRFIMGMHLVLMNGHFVLFQIYIFVFMGQIQILILLIYTPFKDPKVGFEHLLTEIILQFLGYHQLLFTNFVWDPETRYVIGWSFCAFVTLSLFAEFFQMISQSIANYRESRRKKAVMDYSLASAAQQQEILKKRLNIQRQKRKLKLRYINDFGGRLPLRVNENPEDFDQVPEQQPEGDQGGDLEAGPAKPETRTFDERIAAIEKDLNLTKSVLPPIQEEAKANSSREDEEVKVEEKPVPLWLQNLKKEMKAPQPEEDIHSANNRSECQIGTLEEQKAEKDRMAAKKDKFAGLAAIIPSDDSQESFSSIDLQSETSQGQMANRTPYRSEEADLDKIRMSTNSAFKSCMSRNDEILANKIYDEVSTDNKATKINTSQMTLLGVEEGLSAVRILEEQEQDPYTLAFKKPKMKPIGSQTVHPPSQLLSKPELGYGQSKQSHRSKRKVSPSPAEGPTDFVRFEDRWAALNQKLDVVGKQLGTR